jgi:predicted nucleotidyltransferase
MTPPPAIAVTEDQWYIITTILNRHVPDKTIWAFGSRTTGKHKPYSDLDLAIISDTPLPISVLAALEHDFSESDLPFKVDVADFVASSEPFKNIIRTHKIVIQSA